MEILSTGEKIKRARIYKGITLKEICDDKISISKMSCIENGKVKAEDWILEEVARKLDIDFKYLKQDVNEQIEVSINSIKNLKDGEQLEKDALYSLEYAKEYQLYDKAFDLMHILFNYYLSISCFDKIQISISEYHFFLQKSWTDEKLLIYNYDIARYFSANGEYSEALIYYKEIRKTLLEDSRINYRRLAISTYHITETLIRINNIQEAYELAKESLRLIDYLDSPKEKGLVYELLAIISIKLEEGSFDKYLEKALEAYKDNEESKAKLYLKIGDEFFDKGNKEEALVHIKKSLDITTKEQEYGYTECLLSSIEKLIDNKYYVLAEELCENALDKAIKTNKLNLIEKAYYLKALILKNQGSFIQAEMYMNFSLDTLLKYAGKEERYKRYLDVANMYYDIGEVKDSIKYFMLAFSEAKKI